MVTASTPPAPPRVVIAAPRSGEGKTTLTVGIMRALRRRGEIVAPAKVGPDYIDPGYHAVATGRPGRNLDPHLCGEDLIVPLFRHGAAGATVAVVEGVMGLFDGRIGQRGFGSTAHVARLLDAPIVLVIEAKGASRTLAALAHGLATFEPGLRVGGVILNKVRSPRVVAEVAEALAERGPHLLGALPPHDDVVVPSRHLGLVPAAERGQADAALDAAATLVAEHVDLDALLDLARQAGPLTAPAWDPHAQVVPVAGRPKVAVATGRAFTFRYPETDELLTAAGCEVVPVDPLTDDALPEGTGALYLGGGFPQMYASELAASALREAVAKAVAAGMPTVAECAGLLYLCRTLDEVPMAGALPLTARMTPKLTLGYHEATARVDSVLARVGERVRAHEFHRTAVSAVIDRADSIGPALAPDRAWTVGDAQEGFVADPAGTGIPTVLASYQHVHWAGYPRFAQRLAQAAADYLAG